MSRLRLASPLLAVLLFLLPSGTPGWARAADATTALPLDLRERLLDAAQDSALAPWQREVMLGVARGTEGAIPNARYLHSAIYDPVRDRMIVFGGFTKTSDLVNDVWALSLAGVPAWTQLVPAGTPPSGRHLHSAIYDPVWDRMIIYGGVERTQQLACLGDVWALSLTGTPEWTKITASGGQPLPRFQHSAIYDPVRDRMVVFGGYYYGGYRGADSKPLNDTWVLSLSATPTWTQLAPAGDPPAPRYSHSAVYDPEHDRMVCFGGRAGAVLNDVWALSLKSGAAWRAMTPAGAAPAPRIQQAAAYDPVGKRMVILGGVTSQYEYLDDAWSLALTENLQWIRLEPVSTQPSGRSGHSAIFDPIRRRIVTYGGTPDGLNLVNEVWGLALSPKRMGRPHQRAAWDLIWAAQTAQALASTAVSVERARAGTAITVTPNPSRADVTIAFQLARPCDASLKIYDAAGRLVRTLAAGSLPAGAQSVRWDRRTAAGAVVQPGAYFGELRLGGARSVRRFVLVR
jgi:hypothetical protein